jgi:two-component system, OmpR family, KDP operon response regulator KdpE
MTPKADLMRVLLLEDNPTVLHALKFWLDRAHHTVFAAETLAAAYEVAARQSLDLIIADLYLPDGNGMELMRRIAERGALPGIAMSGDQEPETRELCRQAGFAIFLPKPILASSLELAIRQIADPEVR